MLVGIITAILVVIVWSLMGSNGKRKITTRHKNDMKLQISDGLVAYASSKEFAVYNTTTYGKVMSIPLSAISDIHEATENELIERFENVQRSYKTKPINVAEFIQTNLTAVVTWTMADNHKQPTWLDFTGDNRRSNYEMFRGLTYSK